MPPFLLISFFVQLISPSAQRRWLRTFGRMLGKAYDAAQSPMQFVRRWSTGITQI